MSAEAAVSTGRIPQVTGDVVATRRVGAYQQMTFAAPAVAYTAAKEESGSSRSSRALCTPIVPTLEEAPQIKRAFFF